MPHEVKIKKANKNNFQTKSLQGHFNSSEAINIDISTFILSVHRIHTQKLKSFVKMISISALTYKHFSFDLKFKYVNPFSQHYSEIIRSKMVNIFFSASLHIYILSGTHMHRPEYRMGVAHPMVIIRSLCIVLYLQNGLYSTIYSVGADIFMQEDTVKRKGLPKHTTQHTPSLQLTFSTFLIPHHVFLVGPSIVFFLILIISLRTFSSFILQ